MSEPRTLGEHLRKQRLSLKLLQREAAAQLGLNSKTYLNWEHDRTNPPVSFYPAIIQFLGYEPWPEPQTPNTKPFLTR